ncbi:hypothetical protein OSTOST_04141 [Ostertagia ostertagi]
MDWQYAFEKSMPAENDNLGFPYDYGDIMHYPKDTYVCIYNICEVPAYIYAITAYDVL